MEKPARLYEVSVFSALWMVFPASWKRSCPNFNAHDCTIKVRACILVITNLVKGSNKNLFHNCHNNNYEVGICTMYLYYSMQTLQRLTTQKIAKLINLV